MSACYSFQERGACRFGENCRFSHDPNAEKVERPPRQEREPRQDGEQPARRGRGGNRNGIRRNGQRSAKSSVACKNMAENGTCNYGDKCRFSHGDETTKSSPTQGAQDGEQSSAPRRGGNNRRFNGQPRNNDCHEFAEKSECQYGEKCRFKHGESDERDLREVKRQLNGICRAWQGGEECKFNDRCRFAHSDIDWSNQSAAPAAIASN